MGRTKKHLIQVFLLGQVTSLCSHCCPFKPLCVANRDFWWLWPVRLHPCSYSRIKDHTKPPGQQLPALTLSKPLRFLHIVSHFQLSHPTLNTLLYPSSKPFFFFWPHSKACGILVPRPGIEPMHLAVEAWSLNHWTAREVPVLIKRRPALPPCSSSNYNAILLVGYSSASFFHTQDPQVT